MTEWIHVGRRLEPDLPAGRLTGPEQEDLRRLITARDRLQEQLLALDQRIEVLILAARDARGLSGPVRVHAPTGELVQVDRPGGDDGDR